MRGPENRLLVALSALWGFAEATVFILVPDVLLTFIAVRRGWRVAALAALAAAAGAVLGGALTWALAAAAPAGMRAFLDGLPCMSPELIDRAAATMQRPDWPLAMLHGAVTGTPYKLFAAGVAESPVSPALFLLVSLPLRLARFVAAIAAATAASALLGRHVSMRVKTAVLAGFWLVFYAAYFSTMPG